jgi:hypothetical protein
MGCCAFWIQESCTHLWTQSAVMWLKWVATKMVKPIKVQLTLLAATPTSRVVLGAILECGNMKFTENHGLHLGWHWSHLRAHIFKHKLCRCFKRKLEVKIIIRLANRFINLKIECQANLTKVSIHLVSLQKLQETSFLVLMCVDESNAKFKAKTLKLQVFWRGPKKGNVTW